MRAAGRFEVKLVKDGAAPAWLASPDRVDHVEVVDLDLGEVVLFWDLPPKEAVRLVRALREDLRRLDADEFLAAWEAAESA